MNCKVSMKEDILKKGNRGKICLGEKNVECGYKKVEVDDKNTANETGKYVFIEQYKGI